MQPDGANNAFDKINRFLPTFAPQMIFDVGANVGQSARMFAEEYPAAQIHAFEPITATYSELVASTHDLPGVRTHQIALGRRRGSAVMKIYEDSKLNRITATVTEANETETVPVETGDSFCAMHEIQNIDYLKIDAEGHDLDVLVGFGHLLEENKISLVEAEVSLNRANEMHVPLDWIRGYMEPMGYHLFHIFEQTLDLYFTGRPVLRRCNVVFVAETVVADNLRPRKQSSPNASAGELGSNESVQPVPVDGDCAKGKLPIPS